LRERTGGWTLRYFGGGKLEAVSFGDLVTIILAGEKSTFAKDAYRILSIAPVRAEK
jgi:hypothetical protein